MLKAFDFSGEFHRQHLNKELEEKQTQLL